MAQDLVALWYDRALSVQVLIVNGYLYSADDAETFPALPASLRDRTGADLWESEYEPRIRVASVGDQRPTDSCLHRSYEVETMCDPDESALECEAERRALLTSGRPTHSGVGPPLSLDPGTYARDAATSRTPGHRPPHR